MNFSKCASVFFIVCFCVTIAESAAATKPTTKSTTSTTWIFAADQPNGDLTQVCYGFKKMQLSVNLGNAIQSNAANFNTYFIAYPPKSAVANSAICCSLCGTSSYKNCVAFDYNIQTKVCQMYQIQTSTVYFTVEPKGKEYPAVYYDGQASFIYSENYLVADPLHNSGVFYDQGSYIGIN